MVFFKQKRLYAIGRKVAELSLRAKRVRRVSNWLKKKHSLQNIVNQFFIKNTPQYLSYFYKNASIDS